MPIKIELRLIPQADLPESGDLALIAHGSSGSARLLTLNQVGGGGGGGGAARLYCAEDGNYYDQVVVIQDGNATMTLVAATTSYTPAPVMSNPALSQIGWSSSRPSGFDLISIEQQYPPASGEWVLLGSYNAATHPIGVDADSYFRARFTNGTYFTAYSNITTGGDTPAP